ncbi:cyclase family protein [Aestuariivirga litoralis]|uniref:cyclase family protein n=1 Tax=Aestuariivirga litoralis TaxID=2650924 RepID=UPI0018C80EF3|nr:cyclase family protein [Aestuariivirga litoralis]
MKTAVWTGDESDYDLVDLTHVLRDGIPFWPTHPKFKMEQVSFLEKGDDASLHSVCLSEHTGTHFDAPSHFILGGASITQIPVEKFFGRLAKIDAEHAAPDSTIPAQAILDFEAAHGALEKGDAVVISYGWHKLWEKKERFLKDWPGLSEDAAQLLISRGVRLVATDCLSMDHFTSAKFPAHVALLGAGILIGENFAHLDKLPVWSFLTALPLPIENGTGSPVRAVAFVPKG